MGEISANDILVALGVLVGVVAPSEIDPALGPRTVPSTGVDYVAFDDDMVGEVSADARSSTVVHGVSYHSDMMGEGDCGFGEIPHWTNHDAVIVTIGAVFFFVLSR